MTAAQLKLSTPVVRDKAGRDVALGLVISDGAHAYRINADGSTSRARLGEGELVWWVTPMDLWPPLVTRKIFALAYERGHELVRQGLASRKAAKEGPRNG